MGRTKNSGKNAKNTDIFDKEYAEKCYSELHYVEKAMLDLVREYAQYVINANAAFKVCPEENNSIQTLYGYISTSYEVGISVEYFVRISKLVIEELIFKMVCHCCRDVTEMPSFPVVCLLRQYMMYRILEIPIPNDLPPEECK